MPIDHGIVQISSDVGCKVRDTIQSIGGTMLEALPSAEDIKRIKSDLKRTNKGFLKNDKVEDVDGEE